MANSEKKPSDKKFKKYNDELIGMDREARESGIVDPKKDELANQHSIPGQGDPSIRRIKPDQGSVITPPLSDQVDQFEDSKDTTDQSTTSPSETESDEHLVLHTSGGEIPDIPPSSEIFNEAKPGEQPTAKGNTQLPEDRKRKKAA